MADEPRRSGRATKGQHTKNNDDASPPSQKGQKGRKKGAKAASDEPEDDDGDDNAVIRCVCGDREEVDGLSENPKMICCDKCEAWQHNVCMGIPEEDDLLPEQYFCEQCRPQNHKELLAAVSRGERPWEARLQQLREQEKLKKSKKGRKSKGGRNSAVGTESEPATTPKSVAVDVQTPQLAVGTRRKAGQADGGPHEQVSPTVSQAPTTPTTHDPAKGIRRKSTHPNEENPLKRRHSSKLDETALKRRKSSIAFDPPVDHIDQLPDDRKKTAQPLYKQIKALIDNGLKSAVITLPPNETADGRAAVLARDIEYEVYARFPRPEEVTAKNDQLRSILFNIKKNQMLFRDILNGTLSPQELAHMSSEDMASEELQRERAALKEEADKQAIIQHEEGPRLRKTHKGDEFIGEDDHHHTVAEPVFTPTAPGEPVTTRSPGVSQSPAGFARSPTTAGPEPSVNKPLTVDTKGDPVFNERKSSNNFDIQSVWSKVRSPEVAQGGFSAKPLRTPSTSQHQAPDRNPGEDADIDRLLKDDEMEGVFPTGETAGVWHGTLYMRKMHHTLNIRGTAQFFGGANPDPEIPWGQLLNGDVEINGRIATERADEYLCNFRWSTTKIISILKFVPEPQLPAENGENGEFKSNFAQIFDYFLSINRWGVSKSSGQPAGLLDFYIVPVRAGDSPLPKCFEYIENVQFDKVRPEDSLFFVMVIQVRATPTGEMSASAMAPTATPQSDTFNVRANNDDNNNVPGAAATLQAELQGNNAAVGLEADSTFNPPQLAVDILGEFVNTPVARSVLQLPEVSLQQLENLKHAFEADPNTRQDLNYLSQFLKAQAAQRAQQDEQQQAPQVQAPSYLEPGAPDTGLAL